MTYIFDKKIISIGSYLKDHIVRISLLTYLWGHIRSKDQNVNWCVDWHLNNQAYLLWHTNIVLQPTMICSISIQCGKLTKAAMPLSVTTTAPLIIHNNHDQRELANHLVQCFSGAEFKFSELLFYHLVWVMAWLAIGMIFQIPRNWKLSDKLDGPWLCMIHDEYWTQGRFEIPQLWVSPPLKSP